MRRYIIKTNVETSENCGGRKKLRGQKRVNIY